MTRLTAFDTKNPVPGDYKINFTITSGSVFKINLPTGVQVMRYNKTLSKEELVQTYTADAIKKEMVFIIGGMGARLETVPAGICTFRVERITPDQKWRVHAELRYPDAAGICSADATTKTEPAVGEVNEVEQIIQISKTAPKIEPRQAGATNATAVTVTPGGALQEISSIMVLDENLNLASTMIEGIDFKIEESKNFSLNAFVKEPLAAGMKVRFMFAHQTDASKSFEGFLDQAIGNTLLYRKNFNPIPDGDYRVIVEVVDEEGYHITSSSGNLRVTGKLLEKIVTIKFTATPLENALNFISVTTRLEIDYSSLDSTTVAITSVYAEVTNEPLSVLLDKFVDYEVISDTKIKVTGVKTTSPA
jgi:hypothetical protein